MTASRALRAQFHLKRRGVLRGIHSRIQLEIGVKFTPINFGVDYTPEMNSSGGARSGVHSKRRGLEWSTFQKKSGTD